MENVAPKSVESPYGEPGYQKTAEGIHGTSVSGPFNAGVKMPIGVTTPGASYTGQYIQSPPGQGGSGGAAGAANQGMDIAEKMAGRGAVIGASANQTGQDIANHNSAIPQIQVLKTMRDNIVNSPTVDYGPLAPWLTTLKMGIANNAKGLLSDQQLNGLAAANSIDKLTAQLGNILGSNGPSSDARLFNNLAAVPGRAHNTKEGMVDLIDMLIQQQAINHQFISDNLPQISKGISSEEMIKLRDAYFNDHPIINPATQHPIKLDLMKNSQQPATAEQPKNGGWGNVRRAQ